MSAWKPRPTAKASIPYCVNAGASTVGPSVPILVSSNTVAKATGATSSAHLERITSPARRPTQELMTIDQSA
jgi:hypothetical protein